MRLTKVTLAVLAVSCIVGCSKKDKDSAGVYADGRCTDATISVHNEMYYIAQATKNSGTITREKTIEFLGYCDQMNSLLGSRSCRAMNLSSGLEDSIDGAGVQKACSTVREAFKNEGGAESTSIDLTGTADDSDDSATVYSDETSESTKVKSSADLIESFAL